jgi:hypothetical protein
MMKKILLATMAVLALGSAAQAQSSVPWRDPFRFYVPLYGIPISHGRESYPTNSPTEKPIAEVPLGTQDARIEHLQPLYRVPISGGDGSIRNLRFGVPFLFAGYKDASSDFVYSRGGIFWPVSENGGLPSTFIPRGYEDDVLVSGSKQDSDTPINAGNAWLLPYLMPQYDLWYMGEGDPRPASFGYQNFELPYLLAAWDEGGPWI